MHVLPFFHVFSRSKRTALRLLIVGVGAIACVSACGQRSSEPRLTSQSLNRANGILADVAATETTIHPERISHLGLSYARDPALQTRLTDASQAAFERHRLIYIDLLENVAAFPPLPSDHPIRRDLLVTYDTLTNLVALQNINSGPSNLADARPYTVDPFHGVWIEAPTLLLRDHTLDTQQDAAAYLSRLSDLANALNDTSRRLQADAKVGTLAPAALITETKAAIDSLMSPEDTRLSDMVATYAVIIASIDDLSQTDTSMMAREAETILKTSVRPAYTRLSATLDTLTKDARAQGGLWAAPKGEQLYGAYIDWYLSDAGTPATLHTAAMEDVARRTTALETAYTNAGLAAETPTARYDALIARQAEAAAAIPKPRAPLTAEPTTPLSRNSLIAISPLAPLQPSRPHLYPSRFDGIRPLQNIATPQMLALWPDLIEPAIEARAFAYTPNKYQSSSPHTRALLNDFAYQAALQSHIAHETYLRAPTTDDAANIGWHTLRLLEAAMAVADTGLHHERWTLERTQSYLQQTVGLPADFTRQITLEIAAKPARAATHMAAYRRLRALQNRARAVLGNRYSEAAFQNAVMQYGPRPFSMIEADVERWYEAALIPTP